MNKKIAYYLSSKQMSVPDSAFTVLADTGWYDRKTNMDADPADWKTVDVARYRVASYDGKQYILHDNAYTFTSGGSLGFDRKGNFVSIPPKITGPQRGFTSQTKVPYSVSDYMMKGRSRGGYMHPRFTAFKALVRKMLKASAGTMMARKVKVA